MARQVLAADFGGTHLRAAIVDEAGAIVYRRDQATPAGTPTEMVQLVVELLAETVRASGARPSAACIATAGLVNANEGKVILAPNIRRGKGLTEAEFWRAVQGGAARPKRST
jgi:glucokinase